MNSTSDPLLRDVTIVNELGLHARAAAQVAKVARQAAGKIWLRAHDEQVDASQVIDILTLGVGKGDSLKVAADAEADVDLLNQITALFADGFGE